MGNVITSTSLSALLGTKFQLIQSGKFPFFLLHSWSWLEYFYSSIIQWMHEMVFGVPKWMCVDHDVCPPLVVLPKHHFQVGNTYILLNLNTFLLKLFVLVLYWCVLLLSHLYNVPWELRYVPILSPQVIIHYIPVKFFIFENHCHPSCLDLWTKN